MSLLLLLLLMMIMMMFNLYPHCLFDYDVTDLTVVQNKIYKIISLKAKRRVSLSSAERGSLVTTITCMNATVTLCSSSFDVFLE